MNTEILKNLIKEAHLDFGTNHVTLSYDTDSWYLNAHYTQLDDSFTDCELYLNHEKKELTPKERNQILIALQEYYSLYQEGMITEEELIKRQDTLLLSLSERDRNIIMQLFYFSQ